MITVLVVDDHSMVRTGLSALLNAHADIEVLGEAANGEEAVAQSLLLEPDVVLMDLAMPEVDGIVATRRLKEAQPHVRVVILSTFASSDQISAALDAGADGYLLKDITPETLVDGLRAAVQGGAPLSPAVAAEVLADRNASANSARLSAREEQILGLLVSGHSNKQIARELGISEKTVKSHFGRIFQRIGVRDRTQAALWAAKNVVFPTTSTS